MNQWLACAAAATKEAQLVQQLSGEWGRVPVLGIAMPGEPVGRTIVAI
jgi:hypothetical protein